jgi:hypothetical protein
MPVAVGFGPARHTGYRVEVPLGGGVGFAEVPDGSSAGQHRVLVGPACQGRRRPASERERGWLGKTV